MIGWKQREKVTEQKRREGEGCKAGKTEKRREQMQGRKDG